jgi:serine/threonine-protein kinase
LCEEILSGLSAAHQVGVVHRDLKPANIVLLQQSSGELNVKVLDFGLARQLDTAPEPTTRESLRTQALEKSSLLAGTPEYMSPEQVSGKQVGAQGDLYALGVILFEMLTGRLPFAAPTVWELMQQQLLSPPPSLRSLVPSASAPLTAFVERLLAKDPADRPLGARAAAKEIAALLPLFDAAPVADTVLLNRSVELGWQRLPPRPALIGAALLVASVAIALTFAGSTPPRDDARSDSPEPGAASAAQATGWRAAPELEAPAAEPVAALAVRPRARAASALPGAASLTCEPSAGWKKAMREQLEDVEKLSLARLRDDASPAEVAMIKARARTLSASVREASGRGCEQVEAQLRGWRMALR